MWGLCFLAAGVTGDWVLPGPAAPVSSAAPFTCSSASVPALGVVSPTGAASATGSAGRHERAWESARSVRHHRHHVARIGLLPLLALPIRLVHLSPLRLRLRVPAMRLARCLLPLLDVLVWVVVALRVTARHLLVTALLSLVFRDWVRDRDLPQVLLSLALSMVVNLPSLLWPWRTMTALSTFGSVDLDRDNSFRSMLSPLLDFHSLEEPASVTPNWCKTPALVYGLQSVFPGSSLASFPLTAVSPGTHSLGSGQVPGRRPWMYHRTSFSSFRGPYAVLSGLASITLMTVSESRIRSISLSYSQVSSLETMLSSVCEVTSWLDW